MVTKATSRILAFVAATLPSVAYAQPRDYSPEDVYATLQREIRRTLTMPEHGPTQTDPPMWLSLTNVGSVVDPSDVAQLYSVANFCPPASPVIPAFAREPKLDAVYERVINSLIGPERNYTPAYFAALKVIGKVEDGVMTEETPKYKAYRLREDAYYTAVTKFIVAKTPEERIAAELAMNRAKKEWSTFGARGEIDKALDTISAEEFRTGAIRQVRRRDVLDAYRVGALRGQELISLQPFAAPVSTMSPPPDKWGDSAGWFTVKFEMTESLATESRQTTQTSGFGGLSLGFISIGGRAGTSTTTETKSKKVSKLSYGFELKRVTIRRDWLDSSVFFEPRAWTWRKSDATDEYPRVALSLNPSSLPQESTKALYDNQRISFALLPVEAIIARNLTATATMTNSNFAEVNSAWSGGGAVSLFGIFGGAGKRSNSFKDVKDDGNSTTFTVESPGISIIGLVSQVLPLTPDPNVNDKWPANAWLPPQ